jgi:hypothetical protein
MPRAFVSRLTGPGVVARRSYSARQRRRPVMEKSERAFTVASIHHLVLSPINSSMSLRLSHFARNRLTRRVELVEAVTLHSDQNPRDAAASPKKTGRRQVPQRAVSME